MPTSSQLPLHVYYKKCRKKKAATNEEEKQEGQQPKKSEGKGKCLTAKIFVKAKTNSLLSPRPATVPVNHQNSTNPDLRLCARTVVSSQPGLKISAKSSQAGIKIDTYPLNLNGSKLTKGKIFNSVDQCPFLYPSNATVELTKLLNIKAYSINFNPSVDKGIKAKAADMEKEIEFNNFDEPKEVTSIPTVNLPQRGEVFDDAEKARGMSGRKYVAFSPRPVTRDTERRRTQANNGSSHPQLHSGLRPGPSFLVKRVNWFQRQHPTDNTSKVKQALFYPEKSAPYLNLPPNSKSGDQDEDAISWVLRENHPEACVVSNKDVADGKDDNETDDEIEYTFEKPVIHITRKVKKVDKKSVEFEEPNAEDLSIKSVSDTDSDTQLQSLKPVVKQMESGSPRQALKLRTILVSNVKTGKEMESNITSRNNNNNFIVKGISPNKLEYKFEETFPLKTYLTSTGVIQQVAAHNKQAISHKMSPPASARRVNVAAPVQARVTSAVVPSKVKDDFTVRPSTLVSSVNCKSQYQTITQGQSKDVDATNACNQFVPSNEINFTAEDDRQNSLSSKLYRVAKHQRSKHIASCKTPPSTPDTSSPENKAKFPEMSKSDSDVEKNTRSKVPITPIEISNQKSARNSDYEGKWQQAEMTSNEKTHTKSLSKKKQRSLKKSEKFRSTDVVEYATDFRSAKEESEEVEESSESEKKEKLRARKSNKMVEKGSDRIKDLYMDKLKKSMEPVRVFSSKPTEDPLKVCFEFTGTDLTHKQVKMAANETLKESEGCHVTEVEFVPRNVILGTTWCDNRWVLGVNNKLAHRMISGKGIHINGNYVRVRSYQDVLNEEYQRFIQKNEQAGGPSFIDDLLAA